VALADASSNSYFAFSTALWFRMPPNARTDASWASISFNDSVLSAILANVSALKAGSPELSSRIASGCGHLCALARFSDSVIIII